MDGRALLADAWKGSCAAAKRSLSVLAIAVLNLPLPSPPSMLILVADASFFATPSKDPWNREPSPKDVPSKSAGNRGGPVTLLSGSGSGRSAMHGLVGSGLGPSTIFRCNLIVEDLFKTGTGFRKAEGDSPGVASVIPLLARVGL